MSFRSPACGQSIAWVSRCKAKAKDYSAVECVCAWILEIFKTFWKQGMMKHVLGTSKHYSVSGGFFFPFRFRNEKEEVLRTLVSIIHIFMLICSLPHIDGCVCFFVPAFLSLSLSSLLSLFCSWVWMRRKGWGIRTRGRWGREIERGRCLTLWLSLLSLPSVMGNTCMMMTMVSFI